MKLAKILVLAAVAAIAAMAFVGTSSAFADKEHVVLCTQELLECTNLKLWWGYLATPVETHDPVKIVGKAVSPKLLSSIGTVECENSEAEISLLNLLNTFLIAHILKLNFTGSCHLGSTKCEVTVGSLGDIKITHDPELPLRWRGVATKTEAGASTEATVKCGFLINCTYIGGEETETVATNSKTGEVTLTANEAELKKTKGLCPEISKWDAIYKDEMAGLWLES